MEARESRRPMEWEAKGLGHPGNLEGMRLGISGSGKPSAWRPREWKPSEREAKKVGGSASERCRLVILPPNKNIDGK